MRAAGNGAGAGTVNASPHGAATARSATHKLTWNMLFRFFLLSVLPRVYPSSPEYDDEAEVRGVSSPSNSFPGKNEDWVSMQAFKSLIESPDFKYFIYKTWVGVFGLTLTLLLLPLPPIRMFLMLLSTIQLFWISSSPKTTVITFPET
ncbi:hypothetical protein GQ457_07G003700 [Hibiscus cannabinus]